MQLNRSSRNRFSGPPWTHQTCRWRRRVPAWCITRRSRINLTSRWRVRYLSPWAPHSMVNTRPITRRTTLTRFRRRLIIINMNPNEFLIISIIFFIVCLVWIYFETYHRGIIILRTPRWMDWMVLCPRRPPISMRAGWRFHQRFLQSIWLQGEIHLLQVHTIITHIY